MLAPKAVGFEAARSGGRRAESSLKLDTAQQSGKRRNINPEHLLGLRIIESDAVQGNINL